MRQSQWRFHVFTYNSTDHIMDHYRADRWPVVLDRLAWTKVNRPTLTTRVFDINLKPLGKHQRV